MTGRDGLRVRILGRLDACDGDAEIDLGGRRQRAVLAVLVLARGEVVPAERIADCLWADGLPANAGGAVQSYVSHLRRRLQPDGAPRPRRVIATPAPATPSGCRTDAVDAWWFERLVRDAGDRLHRGRAAAGRRPAHRGAELWRGPALSEYAGEPWAEAEIARLTELRAVARERLLAARLDRGEAALLVPELEALVADEPLREERWRLLVLALYRAHRQADALAALRRARNLLSAELGIDPGPALRALEAEVLAQSPALAARSPAPTPAAARSRRAAPPPAARRRAAPPASPPDLVDRDDELGRSGPRSPTFAAGASQLLLIEGPPGRRQDPAAGRGPPAGRRART